MKKYLPRYLLGLVILVALLGHSADIYKIPLITRLDAIIYDFKIRLTMPQTVDDRVVVLDIDEKSLAEMGRWPWGRDKLTRMLDQLFDHYKIRLVGFDVVFAEPDDSSGLKTLESLSKGELKDSSGFQDALRDLRPKLDYDARFAAAMKNRAVILGYYFNSRDEGGKSSGAISPPVFPAGTFGQRQIAFTSWSTFGGNLPAFRDAAAGGGHFNPLVDFDGISRRVPLIVEYKGDYYESLSLAMVRNLLGNPEIVPGYPDDAPSTYGMEWLEMKAASGGTMQIPVDENAAAMIPYRGFQGSFPYYSLADVITGRLPVEKLVGRVAIVGTTAPGLMDLRATPVGAAYAGVEVHANLVAGMLDASIKHKPPYILAADIFLVLLVGAVMAFWMPTMSPLRGTILGFVLLGFLVGVNLLFWSEHIVLPLANGLTVVALLYALNMSWGYFVESRTKRQMTGLFGQYVPPELVEEMSKNPENYSMEGRRADLTVLFSDVRGFTTISEGLEPAKLAWLINEYLSAMSQIIRDHRGTLDKYIGDAIMAFWGAPVPDAQHVRNAVITALEMQVGMKKLNERLQPEGWPEMKIGVGVNSGPMTVGDMGSNVRKAYTVMGDAVNLGSRLEGITKQYGVGILVGEESYVHVKDEFIFRELDRVRVKGKEEPVAIYEPVGEVGKVSQEELDEIKLWNQALRLYRAQDWDAAELALMNLTRIHPRYLYELYAKRIEHLRKEPPGEGWDGVTTFETK